MDVRREGTRGFRCGPRDSSATLVLIHGICHGAWCWHRYLDYFGQQGFDTVAISLRGHGASSGRAHLHRYGLNDYVDDVADVVDALARRPILIGHSMGGAVVQRFMAARAAENISGAVLFASATAGGLGGRRLIDVVRGIRPIELLNSLRVVAGRPITPARVNATPFFGNRLSGSDAAAYADLLTCESRSAVRDLMRRFDKVPASPPPLMVIGSRHDTLFGERSLHRTARAYGVTPVLLDGLCHDMMLDPAWELPARYVVDFVRTVVSA